MKSKTVKYVALCGMFLLIIMFCGAYKADAQTKADKAASAMTDSLAYLKLSDQQKSQALGFNKTAATAIGQLAKKAKQDTSLHGKALAKQVMGIMKQRNTSLKAILTPDQQKLFQQHQLQQLAELQTKMMTAQLDLTDDQVPQVYAINLKYTGEMMGEMSKLKEAKGKLKKMRDAKALKSDSADKDKDMKKILTSDQYTKYEKNKKDMQDEMKEKMKEKKAASK